MKYFTKKLWRDSPATTDAGPAAAWNRARRAYWKELDAMRPQFAPGVFAFFERADVHEGELLYIDVIDGSRPAHLHAPPHPVRVKLALLDVYKRFTWTLHYGAVRRVVVDFPSAAPLIRPNEAGFGLLGFHELTDCGGGFFRHEILFASGATLLVEFRDVDVRGSERTHDAA
jgi:hypothetical protein